MVVSADNASTAGLSGDAVARGAFRSGSMLKGEAGAGGQGSLAASGGGQKISLTRKSRIVPFQDSRKASRESASSDREVPFRLDRLEVDTAAVTAIAQEPHDALAR